MTTAEASRQFSLRLPASLVDQLETCMAEFKSQGLDMSRTDVVRLLLNHSLKATKCKLHLLVPGAVKSAPRRKAVDR
jgi:hypothetical protein